MSADVLVAHAIANVREQHGESFGQREPSPQVAAMAGATTAASSSDAFKKRPMVQVFTVAMFVYPETMQ